LVERGDDILKVHGLNHRADSARHAVWGGWEVELRDYELR
jgi:hypothetical protein